jgi:hypothetical protein
MSREYQVGDQFICETDTRQYQAGESYVNETVAASGGGTVANNRVMINQSVRRASTF